MPKKLDDSVLDGTLTSFASTTRISVCSGEPADFAGIAALTIANVTVTPGDGNGDFTFANGDVSGRKCTISQQDDLSVTATATANHLSYDNGAVLLGVTTTTDLALTSGEEVTIPAHDLEIADPV